MHYKERILGLSQLYRQRGERVTLELLKEAETLGIPKDLLGYSHQLEKAPRRLSNDKPTDT